MEKGLIIGVLCLILGAMVGACFILMVDNQLISFNFNGTDNDSSSVNNTTNITNITNDTSVNQSTSNSANSNNQEKTSTSSGLCPSCQQANPHEGSYYWVGNKEYCSVCGRLVADLDDEEWQEQERIKHN